MGNELGMLYSSAISDILIRNRYALYVGTFRPSD